MDNDVHIEFEDVNNEDTLPELTPLSDSEDEDGEDNGEYSPLIKDQPPEPLKWKDKETLLERVERVLYKCCPFPGDKLPIDSSYSKGDCRFSLELLDCDMLEVYDRIEVRIHLDLVCWHVFLIGRWYAEQCTANHDFPAPWDYAHEWMTSRRWRDTTVGWTKDIHPE